MDQRDEQNEFLNEAAQESLRIVETNGIRACDEFSLCMPTSDADQTSYRRFGCAVLLRLMLGLLGVIGGGIIAFLAKLEMIDQQPFWLLLMVCCSGGGILTWMSNSFLQRRFVRYKIGTRYKELVSLFLTCSPVCVSMENPATFHKFKLMPEDLGYLALDSSRKMLVIEGIRYRYLIHSKDVIRVEQVTGASSTATAIEYTIGNTTLHFTMQHDNLWHELKRQAKIAKQDMLFTRINETLGIDVKLPNV